MIAHRPTWGDAGLLDRQWRWCRAHTLSLLLNTLETMTEHARARASRMLYILRLSAAAVAKMRTSSRVSGATTREILPLRRGRHGSGIVVIIASSTGTTSSLLLLDRGCAGRTRSCRRRRYPLFLVLSLSLFNNLFLLSRVLCQNGDQVLRNRSSQLEVL